MEAWGGYLIDQVAAKAENSIKFQPNLVLLHVGTKEFTFSLFNRFKTLFPTHVSHLFRILPDPELISPLLPRSVPMI